MFRYLREAIGHLGDIKMALNKLAQGHTDFQLSGCLRTDRIGRVSLQLHTIRDGLQRGRQHEEDLQRQLSEKEAVLDNAPFAILCEQHGIIAACNARGERMFGYEPGELLGQPSRVLCDHAPFGVFAGEWASAGGADRAFTGMVTLRRKNGETFEGLLAAGGKYARGDEGGRSTWICFENDVAEAIARQTSPDPSPRPESLSFDFAGVLTGVAATLAGLAAEREVEIILDIAPDLPHFFLGDPFSLAQVFRHLVHNAIKFSTRGEVVISVHGERQRGARLELCCRVRDNGNGIVAPIRSQLAETLASPGGGDDLGTGLAISKSLVERLGGTLRVDGLRAQGASFFFSIELPVATQPWERMRADEQRLKSFAGRPVLVIDDSSSSRGVIGTLLSSLGFRPDLFESGQAALAWLASSEAPNYLFACIDWLMPELDGLEVARCMFACYGHSCPPLLLMAPFGRSAELEDKACDIASVVSKPLGLQQLLSRIAALLGVPKPECGRPALDIDQSLAAGLKGKRLLVVGGTELDREILVDFLRLAEMQVCSVADGLEALEAVREETPDCILMTCDMPIMSGYETSARLRALGYTSLPIIALGIAQAGDAAGCLAAGMSDLLAKPLDFQLLLATLVRWISLPAAGMVLTADGEVLPPLPPGLDVESGLKRLRGKTALFLKALRMFRDSRGQQFQTILRTAVTARDWQTSERLAHNLKDTAATIGAKEVSAAAGQLEAAIRTGAYGEAQLLLAMVTDKLRIIVEGLAHIG